MGNEQIDDAIIARFPDMAWEAHDAYLGAKRQHHIGNTL